MDKEFYILDHFTCYAKSILKIIFGHIVLFVILFPNFMSKKIFCIFFNKLKIILKNTTLEDSFSTLVRNVPLDSRFQCRNQRVFAGFAQTTVCIHIISSPELKAHR